MCHSTTPPGWDRRQPRVGTVPPWVGTAPPLGWRRGEFRISDLSYHILAVSVSTFIDLLICLLAQSCIGYPL